MIKCDFCVQSYYDKDGKVRATNGCSITWCQDAIKTMSEHSWIACKQKVW